jgi:putative hydrolase of the HAD superfamily
VVFQIFTNGDMVHAVRALERLGLEDCFEGIICFETLNPPCPPQGDQEPAIFDIAGHFARSGTADELPKTPVLCKPNVDAMEEALRIANVNPHKAVSFRALAPIIISVPVPDVAFTPEEPFFLIYFSV